MFKIKKRINRMKLVCFNLPYAEQTRWKSEIRNDRAITLYVSWTVNNYWNFIFVLYGCFSVRPKYDKRFAATRRTFDYPVRRAC